MKPLYLIGRPILLLVLFGIGVGLIWHVSHNLFPRSYIRVPPQGTTNQVAAPAETVIAEMPPGNLLMENGNARNGSTEVSAPRLLKTERGWILATDPILFNSGVSTLREASIPRLDGLAKSLKEKPDLELEIVGYADNSGTESANLKVAAERAAVVMDYLIFQGIAPARLKSKGMGSADPKGSNNTLLGRQANRRIEFWVTN